MYRSIKYFDDVHSKQPGSVPSHITYTSTLELFSYIYFSNYRRQFVAATLAMAANQSQLL